MTNNFKESEHPRDELGRFTDGTESKSKEIIIKGDELGEYKDIKELRKKAIEYYKENLQGTSIKRNDIGEIRFSGKGISEFRHFSANEDKIKILPFIKSIISKGELGKFRELEHTRKDDIIGFYPINSNIILDGSNKEIEVLIARDKKGNLFYDFFVDRPKEIRVFRGGPRTKQGVFKNSSTDIITPNPQNVNPLIEDYVLNIFIKDKPQTIMKVQINNNLTNREIDDNGFLYVKNNLILKDGVMEYLGDELLPFSKDGRIGNVKIDKDKIYKLNISLDELKKCLPLWANFDNI